MRLVAIVTVLLLVAAGQASAVDGVLEINQTCATGPGCFAGDLPGFPVTISGSSAYRLTSDLTTGPGDSTAVETALGSRADIDLNGFTIRGPATCTGAVPNLVCSNIGTTTAVLVLSEALVHDGFIAGYQVGVNRLTNVGSVRLVDLVISSVETGVLTQGNASLERVQIRGTSGSCVFAQATIALDVTVRSSRIVDCNHSGIAVDPSVRLGVFDTLVERVGFAGVAGGADSAVRGVLVRNAGTDGIVCGTGCVVESSQSADNTGRGIAVGEFSSIVGSEIRDNRGNAINAGNGSTISRNTVMAADSQIGPSQGIVCGAGCGVFENVVRFATTPINLGVDSRASRNVMSLYDNPPSLGTSAGDNLCSGVDC